MHSHSKGMVNLYRFLLVGCQNGCDVGGDFTRSWTIAQIPAHLLHHLFVLCPALVVNIIKLPALLI